MSRLFYIGEPIGAPVESSIGEFEMKVANIRITVHVCPFAPRAGFQLLRDHVQHCAECRKLAPLTRFERLPDTTQRSAFWRDPFVRDS